ncbi:hypothetical protein [uncultured Henriciella sp.]|uniref:hypothetical protein n=1 Tax=uncultured Henriciella sp. TaxID=1608424 RepID=UPI0032B2CC1F
MRGIVGICLGAAFLAQAALSQEPPQSSDRNDEIERLPGELDSFVQEAIREGLLKPARSPQPDEAVEVEDVANVDAPEDIPPAMEVAAEASARTGAEEYLCPDVSPLDLTEFVDFVSYNDLSAWRSVLEDSEPTIASRRVMARAYISLGLIAEARAELEGDMGQGGVALRQLIELLERGGRPDPAYLSQIAACHEDDGVWFAIALLKANDPAGADLLANHFNAFRRLPLRLRADASLIVIPALDRLDRPILSERLMTSFTAEEIAASRQLQFVKALQRLAMGTPSAANTVREYLRRAEYRNEAAAALRRHGKAISSDVERDIVDQYVDALGSLPAEASVSDNLAIILQDLNETVGYDMTLRLAAIPAAADPASRARLAGHFEAMIDTDLESNVFLVNLKAMDALLKAGALLEAREGTDGRYAKASAIAANLGLRTMSEKLSSRLENDTALGLAQAELAFQLEDHEGLARLTEAFPENIAIRKVALIDAIRRGDSEAFGTLSRGIPGDAETALMLIEADAAAGHWIVPQRFYSRASQIEDEDAQMRALRIAEARPAATNGQDEQIALTDVSTRLETLRQSLGTLPKEAR